MTNGEKYKNSALAGLDAETSRCKRNPSNQQYC